MKKRVTAILLFTVMILPVLCLPLSAEQVGTPFPYEELSDYYFSIATAYPAWERDLRDSKNAHYAELCYTVPFYVTAWKEWWTETDFETFESIDNYVATQSGNIEQYKVPGMWEAREALAENDGQVSVSWDIQDHADNYFNGSSGGTESARETTQETIIEKYRESFENFIARWDDIEGTVSVKPYIDGTLVETHWERVKGGTYKQSEYCYIRPIPEVPDMFLYYYFKIRDDHDDGTYHESTIAQWEQWKDMLFTSKYDIVWDDDYRNYLTGATEQHGEATHEAEADPGEDGGVFIPSGIVEGDSDVSIPGAIAVGILGGAAAVGAAAAASGGEKSDDRKKKMYKMYVQKDFGDAIRRGAEKPVKIRARMAEVDIYGNEHDRNDLTANITVSADGMTVHGASLAGRYCEATVSVPQENGADTATVTFTYIGEGGSFRNNVVFRVIDGPSFRFLEETEGSASFTLGSDSAYMDAIAGDGLTYSRKFMIVDAVVPPEAGDISVKKPDGLDVSVEKTDLMNVFRMNVKNSIPDKETKDVFEKPEDKHIELSVALKDEKEPVRGYATVNVWTEGIHISSEKEGSKNDIRYVYVQAYEKDYVGDLDNKWQVSEFRVTLALKDGGKALVDPEGIQYGSEKLKGAGGLVMSADKEQCLAEKYEYKVTNREFNGKQTYTFEPNASLGEPDDGTFFIVMLPVTCAYKGKTYTADVPLRLRGIDPNPLAEWEKEYEELRRRIEKFSLPETRDRWLQHLESCALEPRASVQELHLVGKLVLREYMTYWTAQNSRDRAEATMYNVIVNTLEWTKFAGDCAFSFLMTIYAGPVAEALISPAKDFITGAIGEVIAARNHGEAIDVDKFEFSKNLAAAGDNLVSNSISLTNWRTAAATLAGYFCYAAIKNYFLKMNEKGESDFFGALCEGFKDMTAAALKAKGGELIGKWLTNSKSFQDKIAPYIVKYFKETNMGNLQKNLNDALDLHGDLKKVIGFANEKETLVKIADVVEKYVGELVGQGCSKVREAYDSSSFSIENAHVMFNFDLVFFDAYKYGISLDLTQIMFNMSCPFFGWIYDYFFGKIPAAEAPVEPPKDPALPPKKD